MYNLVLGWSKKSGSEILLGSEPSDCSSLFLSLYVPVMSRDDANLKYSLMSSRCLESKCL